MKYKGKPIYKAGLIDESTGFDKISLVDFPAVESDFLKFKKEENEKEAKEERMTFAVSDEEKRLIFGVVMRADFPILRLNQYGDEFYIVFEKELIREISERAFVSGAVNQINLMHAFDVEGVRPVQMFLKDSVKGVSPKGFETIEEGSLFGEFHVLNDDVWAKVKDGTFRGFSIEGGFTLEEKEEIKNKKMDKKNLFQKIIEGLKPLFVECKSVATDKGLLFIDGEGDEISEGVEVYADENKETVAEDGVYKTDDGKEVEVKEGKVVKVSEVEGEEKKEETEIDVAEEIAEAEVVDETEENTENLESRIANLEKEVGEILDLLKGLKENKEELKSEADPHEEFKKVQEKGIEVESGDKRSVKRIGLI